MARGEVTQPKVHFKGNSEDFIVFIDDTKAAEAWKTDKSIPLAQIVSSFKIFVTNKHGTQGGFDGASNLTLENEFGTSNEEEVIKLMIEKGTMREYEFPERTGAKNDSNGPRVNH